MDMQSTSMDIRQAKFSTSHFPSLIVEAFSTYRIGRQSLVINPSPLRMRLNENSDKSIAPFSSTILVKQDIVPTDNAIVIDLPKDLWRMNSRFFEEWQVFKGHLSVDFFKSPQDSLGILKFNPFHLTQKGTNFWVNQQFELKANLWMAKKGTHCGIHHEHDFIEIHTQVFGTGRMQTFQSPYYTSLSEEILMAPGYTTSEAFCRYQADDKTEYPYHQYYADTDSVWLAIEYHPLTKGAS